MVQSAATSVAQYLDELPAERRREIEPALALVRKHLPKGYAEAMQYGMIGWAIPLSVFPDAYNKQPLCYVALAAQKQYNTLYLTAAYADSPTEQMLRAEFARAGKKLDMGKCCIRFRRYEDLVPAALGKAIAALPPARFIEIYEASRAQAGRGRTGTKAIARKGTAKKAPAKKAVAKKAPAKKAAARKSPSGRSRR